MNVILAQATVPAVLPDRAHLTNTVIERPGKGLARLKELPQFATPLQQILELYRPFYEHVFQKPAGKFAQIEQLDQLRKFLRAFKYERMSVFRGTPLDGTDCLTLCAVGGLLARELGVPVEVGVPCFSHKICHAFLVGKLATGHFVYRMAGTSQADVVRTLDYNELLLRLKIISPIIRTANRLRGVS